MNREELAWAAGFFDGEGSVIVRMVHGKLYLTCSVPQKDRRALDRFQTAILGLGIVRQRRDRDLHIWSSCGPTAQAVVALLWAWLGPVKRDQARTAMIRWVSDWHKRYG